MFSAGFARLRSIERHTPVPAAQAQHRPKIPQATGAAPHIVNKPAKNVSAGLFWQHFALITQGQLLL